MDVAERIYGRVTATCLIKPPAAAAVVFNNRFSIFPVISRTNKKALFDSFLRGHADLCSRHLLKME